MKSKSRPKYAPAVQRLMRAQNEFFTAGAIWQRHEGIWSCILAAPILHWMRRLDPATAKVELARRGCSWEWLDLNTHSFAQTDFLKDSPISAVRLTEHCPNKSKVLSTNKTRKGSPGSSGVRQKKRV